MLTIKNRRAFRWAFVLCLAALLSACSPPGSRALVKGKKLLDRARYADAVEKLGEAASLLKTNALAYNLLGIAYHHSGQPDQAAQAYRHALKLNHDLVEAHYNLGCLLMEQNTPDKLEGAKTEFIAYTLRKGNSAEGFLKLGSVQLKLREPQSAERSFNEALRFSPENPEALTGCALARLQRGKAAEAMQFLKAATNKQPNYPPALLNVAIIEHQFLHNRERALELYRQYLGLTPQPANAASVKTVVQQLQQEIAADLRRQTNAIAIQLPAPAKPTALVSAAAPTNLSKGVKAEPAPAAAKTTAPARTEVPKPIAVAKPETPKAESIRTPPQPKPAPATSPPPPAEVVRLPAEPVIKAAQEVATMDRTTPASAVESTSALNSVPTTSAPAAASAQKAGKKGFFQKVNPLNLFSSDSAPKGSTPMPAVETNVAKVEPTASFPRYVYKARSKPTPGDHKEAERAFAQGLQAHQAHRLPEAIQAYRKATQLDPAFFDPYYNLGLAALEMGNLPLTYSACEGALAVTPDSLDARYNFALALKQGNYVLDAAAELERVLRVYPNESRAHLVLGNIYAQQLRDSAKAREHYVKVLQNDPRNPQAPTIRYWLAENQR